MSGENGIRRSDVVNWYLKEKESEIESEAELEQHTFLIGKIIDRLVKNVSCNFELNFETLSHVLFKEDVEQKKYVSKYYII